MPDDTTTPDAATLTVAYPPDGEPVVIHADRWLNLGALLGAGDEEKSDGTN